MDVASPPDADRPGPSGPPDSRPDGRPPIRSSSIRPAPGDDGARETWPLLVERFRAVAAVHGARTAVDLPPSSLRAERVRWSYAELDRTAATIARAIDSRVGADATREPIVAVLLSRDTPHLYAAQLAVLSLGAAFTCIDPSFPADHVRAILADAAVEVLLTDRAGAAWLNTHHIGVRHAVDIESLAVPAAGDLLPPAPPWLTGSRLAYLIYTSGTTGAPKGVEIEHGSIANLVDADVERFGLDPSDRVAQCSSPAYDSSIEETWLAFAVGATLVPLDEETVRLGPDLVPWLKREGITVLCPPPTLLRTTGCMDPERALPALRFLYVGGEALPHDVADRWGRGRWLENGYGPTECTVTVVRTRIEPGKPVTIGEPVRGNRALVLDDALDEVPEGSFGELAIVGRSLARGYRGKPEVTAERFVEHPNHGRLYRTGDLVRRTAEGLLEYHGRIDGQVKLRGYRVELGAVEAALAAHPGVREAACRVQEDAGGGAPILIAHVVLREPATAEEVAALLERCREHCRATLPRYMVPARIRTIDLLPRSVGGKLDRKALPSIEADARALDDGAPAGRLPESDRERMIAGVVAATLRRTGPIAADHDFFLALGGDSLSAVGVVCGIRAIGQEQPGLAPAERAGLSAVTVRDLYETRTIEGLARRSEERIARAASARVKASGERPKRATAERTHAATPALAAVAQGAFLLLSIAVTGWLWWGILFGVGPWLLAAIGPVATALITPPLAVLAVIAWTPIAVLLTATTHRMLVGRSRPGAMPVWSGPFVRHWLVEQVARLIPWSMLEGTIFLGMALRALGAKVGQRVHVHRGVGLGRGAWDLLTIGDDATLAQEASLHLMELDRGMLVLAPVSIGARASIGVRAGVGGGATVGEGAMLEALSYLPPGSEIPAGERWDGVPARSVGRSTPAPTPRDRGMPPLAHGACALLLRVVHALWWGVAAAAGLLLVEAIGGQSGAAIVAWLYEGDLSASGLLALSALSLVGVPIGLAALGLGVRLFGRIEPGTMNRWGFDGMRVWASSAAVDSAGRWLSGTLYWPHWLRLAGMRIGRGCEISTIIDVVPSSVTIGETCFFADGIYFCSPVVREGTITLEPTRIGSGTFLGNHAVVPGGASYPDGLFIGVSTVADAARARAASGRDGQSGGSGWFGHPAMELPRREVVEVDRSLTHEPSAIRVVSRLFWETLRFLLPVLPAAVVLAWVGVLSHTPADASAAWLVFVTVPTATLAAMASSLVAILALKWALLGRVRPGQHPLWSCWCSRWDFLYVAWGLWARGLLQRLEGTVFLVWYLRAIGMRIGRRVVLGGGFSQVVDPDMLTFEDGATVNCNFQAHTFEDRILKIDHLVIRADATVGHHTVVFYGADIGERARVEPHSVVMKLETLEADGLYAGCPTSRVE